MEEPVQDLGPVLLKIAESNVWVIVILAFGYFAYKIILKKLELEKQKDNNKEEILKEINDKFEELEERIKSNTQICESLKLKFTFLKSDIED